MIIAHQIEPMKIYDFIIIDKKKRKKLLPFEEAIKTLYFENWLLKGKN